MLELEPIERRSGLDSQTFAAEFLEPMVPVVFTDLMAAAWPYAGRKLFCNRLLSGVPAFDQDLRQA